jgi:hypothetical protein
MERHRLERGGPHLAVPVLEALLQVGAASSSARSWAWTGRCAAPWEGLAAQAVEPAVRRFHFLHWLAWWNPLRIHGFFPIPQPPRRHQGWESASASRLFAGRRSRLKEAASWGFLHLRHGAFAVHPEAEGAPRIARARARVAGFRWEEDCGHTAAKMGRRDGPPMLAGIVRQGRKIPGRLLRVLLSSSTSGSFPWPRTW